MEKEGFLVIIGIATYGLSTTQEGEARSPDAHDASRNHAEAGAECILPPDVAGTGMCNRGPLSVLRYYEFLHIHIIIVSHSLSYTRSICIATCRTATAIVAVRHRATVGHKTVPTKPCIITKTTKIMKPVSVH
mmetsp:Transcript_30714/g.70777  ORF Transcript_30714/g.70777 Transcript_30714/m.70777 type:complete len:133 (-) Transcript_30714:1258-1656(-)